jgi:hypothetical protein
VYPDPIRIYTIEHLLVQGDICQLEKKVGPCRDLVERYHFDPKMGTCQKFFFGGCDGTSCFI